MKADGRSEVSMQIAFTVSSLILILTPLQKIILENMLCDTDNESLLVEDHFHPILFLKGSAEDCPGQ